MSISRGFISEDFLSVRVPSEAQTGSPKFYENDV